MKLVLSILLTVVSQHLFSQNDTLREESLRKVADIVFQQLTPQLFGNALINRSFSTNEITLNQLKGNYSQKHSIIEYLALYEDIILANIDSTKMMSIEAFSNFINQEFAQNELNNEEDMLIQPFGFLLQNVSYIDSTKFIDSNFAKQGFSLMPTVEESSLYERKVLKSAAILEFYPESGYSGGFLKYTPEIINVSDDITNLELQVNVGNGFILFNEQNNLIEYNRRGDSLMAKLAFKYELDSIEYNDTLDFYLTTKGETIEKSLFGWDLIYYDNNSTNVDLEIGVLRGCGNESPLLDFKFKRPIIIVPPYRPTVQSFSMQKYFDQFNVADLFTELTSKGYDVIFIKLKPGNASLETSGQAIIEYITEVNENKKEGFPDEDWENVLMGYSMGGQIARYALKKMEKDHIDNGAPHHHTKLYIPYDSPHLGANVPFFTQLVYKELKNSNILAYFAYGSLTDDASKDMGIAHVLGSNINNSNGNTYNITPAVTSERANFVNALENDFNHQFTPLYDMRKSFPSFTRNIAISTGSNEKDYNELYDLQPGKLLFEQNAIGYGIGGLQSKYRKVFASKYTNDHTLFRIKDRLLIFLIPITLRDKDYRMQFGQEFDLAQGGYKDEFYDKIPSGVTPILRLGAFGLGQKHYDNHMSFLPMISAFAINPSIWANNNLHYNLKANGLMYNSYQNLLDDIKSDFYGYPNLGLPANHFSVTPFEAVYADLQTYEHIKLQASIDDNSGYSATFLDSTTQFLINEIEANNVYLQNKVIGDNHIQGSIGYRYKAWYKAQNTLTIGEKVTPKTDVGAYVIKATGYITVYAGESISIKPGFHAQAGSNFHAYIDSDPACNFSGIMTNDFGMNQTNTTQNSLAEKSQEDNLATNRELQEDLQIYPNPSEGTITIIFPNEALGNYEIVNTLGIVKQRSAIPSDKKTILTLEKGIYLINCFGKTKKILIL